MFTYSFEELFEPLVILIGQSGHVLLRPLEKLFVLFGEVIADLLLNLGQLILLLFNYLLVLDLFFDALLDANSFNFPLMILNFSVNTLDLGVNLLDYRVDFLDLLLEGLCFCFEMLKS